MAQFAIAHATHVKVASVAVSLNPALQPRQVPRAPVAQVVHPVPVHAVHAELAGVAIYPIVSSQPARTKVVPSAVVYLIPPVFTLPAGTVVQAPVAVDEFKADFESQTQSASSSRPVKVKVVDPVGHAVHGRDAEPA